MSQKQPRLKNEAHLQFLRMLPCCICLDPTQTQAAHLRMGNLRAGKRPTGLQEKPDDAWALPLCDREHREQHSIGEMKFWAKYGIDPFFLALALFRVSGNVELGEVIIGSNAPAFAGQHQ